MPAEPLRLPTAPAESTEATEQATLSAVKDSSLKHPPTTDSRSAGKQHSGRNKADQSNVSDAGEAKDSTKLPSDAKAQSSTSEPAPNEVHKNPVRQSVEEICQLLGDSHEVRQEITARGVQFNTLNVLIDFGTKDKHEEQAELIKSAVSASQKEFGDQGITSEQLEKHLDTLVTIERDLGHVRRLSQNQGLNMQALNFLTQMIRLNPGDGGEKSVNNLMAYAVACGIKVEGFKQEAKELTAGTGSVLPQIPKQEPVSKEEELKNILRDVLIGLAIGMGVLWLFL